MPEDNKIQHRLKLATALKKILDRNKERVISHAVKDEESFWIVDSLRQLEAASGLSYTIVQGVFAAKRDLQFTSLMTLVGDGLGLTFSEFAEIFDSVTDEEIKNLKKHIASAARTPVAVAAKKKKKK